MSTKNIILTVIGLCAAGVAARWSLSNDTRPERQSPQLESCDNSLDELAGLQFDPNPENQLIRVELHGGANVKQYAIGYGLDDGAGGLEPRLVALEKVERVGYTNEWVKSYRRFAVNGEIVGIQGRHYNDLFIALRSGGKTRIERWVLSDVSGAWTAKRPLGPAIGGAWTTPASSEELIDGVWRSPTERASDELPERRLLLVEFSSESVFHGYGVDADGRYYLTVVDDAIELRSAIGNNSPLQVWTSSSLGYDVSKVDFLFSVQSPSYGRVMYAEFADPARPDLALIDAANDGIFELSMLVTRTGELEDAGEILLDRVMY